MIDHISIRNFAIIENTEIIDNNGKVNRPNSEKEIVNVVAHITYDDETKEDKEFNKTFCDRSRMRSQHLRMRRLS